MDSSPTQELYGTPGCEYCRISKEDVQTTLGSTSAGLFGGCVPWPCHSFLGQQTPEICQHYVHAPQNVTIEFVDDPSTKYDTIVVSWRPSPYGIAFLRGFQVTLQALGGTQGSCQLFLLQNNLLLSGVHTQRVFYSSPFSYLALGAEYAVTVMALPVPELWDRFYQSTQFFTRTCPEKHGLEHCKTDWYPRYVEVHQNSNATLVTFNLAPEKLGISRYFLVCHGGGSRSYEIIQPDLSINTTHHTHCLAGLHAGINYTCEIAADIADAVRKKFFVQFRHHSTEPSAFPRESPSLAIILSVGVLLVASLTTIFVILYQKRLRKKTLQTEIRPDIIEEYYDKPLDEPQCVALNNSAHPPQLLICYSSADGPVHVRAILQLATFLQKHMATKVHLDLWDALGIMEEGKLEWYCRRMKESDFVMVICSRHLSQKEQSQRKEEDDDPVEDISLAMPAIIAGEICRAKALGQDLSKYMTAIFEYSEESDIPTVLKLVSNYTLPRDLPLLFSHLHGVSLQKPGAHLRVENISENEYSKLPAGAALFLAIQEAKTAQCPTEERTGDYVR
ncbi:interleukin-17 receptor D [Hoplias malabaricus]|uniref:interleukin-17 receptor D n=1 Tax=Hoplias malabaricus TaxID=27720 RepID=UPI003461B3AF